MLINMMLKYAQKKEKKDKVYVRFLLKKEKKKSWKNLFDMKKGDNNNNTYRILQVGKYTKWTTNSTQKNNI